MNIPLSEQLRPKVLHEVYGQPHLVGEKGLLSKIVSAKKPLSILLYGPPGCGKTTIAKLYASAFDLEMLHILPQTGGIQEIKQALAQKQKHPLFAASLLVFVDEIHRFNKQQQDLFLPFIEDGSIILIAATTENPTFAINKALLSRLRILQLNPLNDEALEKVLDRCLNISSISLTLSAKKTILQHAAGDARKLLNVMDSLSSVYQGEISDQEIEELSLMSTALYDKAGDWHYALISALHKSIRGSDPQAALYWLARILAGGEDRDFLARRLTRMASEDIGLSDPGALTFVMSCWHSVERLGQPEGDLALAQAVVYLALAPKSNAIYTAFDKAKKVAQETSQFAPPNYLINNTEPWNNSSEKYIYDHDTVQGFSGQDYFPKDMENHEFYMPIERGFERELNKRIAYFKNLKERLKKENTSAPEKVL